MSAPCPHCGRTDYDLLLTKSGKQVYSHHLRFDGTTVTQSVCYEEGAQAEAHALLEARKVAAATAPLRLAACGPFVTLIMPGGLPEA